MVDLRFRDVDTQHARMSLAGVRQVQVDRDPPHPVDLRDEPAATPVRHALDVLSPRRPDIIRMRRQRNQRPRPRPPLDNHTVAHSRATTALNQPPHRLNGLISGPLAPPTGPPATACRVEDLPAGEADDAEAATG